MINKAIHPLPVPTFYDPANAARWAHRPDANHLLESANTWRAQHNVTYAAADDRNVHLLVIDMQKDFCLPEGTLFVGGRSGTGAIDDSRRLAEFIYRNLNVITNITVTMDTHFSHQIFFPSFWLDEAGNAPTPHQTISSDAIRAGHMRPNPAVAGWLCNGNYPWLIEQVRHYAESLEKAGKYELYLWPPHCLLGSEGHALTGIVHEAHLFHAFARGAQSWVEVKGGHPLTENYSVLRPEVLTRHDGAPLGQRNTGFIETLLTSDAVIVAGQASSHCVKSSIDDLLAEIVAADPNLARKIYVMTDCMSAVTVPDGKGGFVADFTEEADAAHQRFADAGMHLVRSTDPMSAWPTI